MLIFHSTFPQVGEFIVSLEGMGIADSKDMYGGATFGAEVPTSSINPANWTRSYSRTGYLDPLADNGNYDVLTDAFVMRILFDSSSPSSKNLTATGVQYTLDTGATNRTLKVNKEVILAAGTVGSPAVLMHSGVGPKDVLSEAGVQMVSELPGVGQHLQDHLVSCCTYFNFQVF
jgi:choline dehydrogenase-like flavoprotein